MVLGLRSEILESPTGPPPFASGAFLFVFGVSAEGAQAQLVKTEEVQGLQVLYYIWHDISMQLHGNLKVMV